MSGTFNDRPGEDDRAGLYVLGALNAEEMRAVQIAANRDPELAAEITVWEQRLAPLVALIDPLEPPASLWLQLEARLLRITGSPDQVAEVYSPPPQRARPRRRGTPSRAQEYWRGAALAAMALAAGLAIALVYKPAAQHQQVAMLLPAKPGEGGWLLTVKPGGEIVADAQGALSRGLNQDYELWAGEDGSDRPVPLGLLSVTGRSTIKTANLPTRHNFLLLVSLEQKGGSPSGIPTGPVVFSSAAIKP
jgi:anti-sigma-K factor RskA